MVGEPSEIDEAQPFAKLFQLGPDETDYRLVSRGGVAVDTFRGRRFLIVEPDAIAQLAEEAFADVSHLFCLSHLAQLRSIFDDADASANDRFVALELLKTAVISGARQFPSTAIVATKKGAGPWKARADFAIPRLARLRMRCARRT